MSAPYGTADPLEGDAFAIVRRETIFGCCKWDPQFEDVSVLCDFPVVLPRSEWVCIAALAERLAAEALAAEEELVARPELHGRLGLSRAVRKVLGKAARRPPRAGPRVLRFDFHFTTEGWQISEVNSDVPGGFIEASGFTRRMAACFPSLQMAGDPAGAYAHALAECLPAGALVVLAHATAYTDDRQVMVYLARQFEARGLRCCLASPAHLGWQAGRARVRTAWCTGWCEAVVRFFPGEWLPTLPRGCAWEHFFHGSRVPLSNPATALATQSKRFPLVWSELDTPLPTWQALLPQTVDPRHLGTADDLWVFKPALGRVGEDVAMHGVTPGDQWGRIRRAVRRRPGDWAAQRRFEAVPLDGPRGPVFPQIGIFTLNDRAVGVYGRLAPRPLIDSRAQDVAVLLANDQQVPHPTDAGATR